MPRDVLPQEIPSRFAILQADHFSRLELTRGEGPAGCVTDDALAPDVAEHSYIVTAYGHDGLAFIVAEGHSLHHALRHLNDEAESFYD